MMTQVLNVTHQMTNITNSTQQSIQRLEIQINQIHQNMSERERESSPNTRATQPQQIQSNNQIQNVNVIHTLRSGKEVDNQVVIPNQINPSIPKHSSDPVEESTINKSDSSSSLEKLKDKESEPIFNELIYKPIAPFPNRLKAKRHSP